MRTKTAQHTAAIPPVSSDWNPNSTDDPRTICADIIDLPHHEPDPVRHPRMPLYKRAAQFAPFAALSGYDEMIREEQRMVDTGYMKELEDREAEILNQQIRRLLELTEAGEHPAVSITYFEPDIRKTGGRYVQVTDAIKRVDRVNRVIELISMEGFLNKTIMIDRMSRIEIMDNQSEG